MKNHSFLFFISVIFLFSCQRKAVPVYEGWVIGDLVVDSVYSMDGLPDSVLFRLETFKVGGGDTLFRKIVIDSSWVDVK